MMKPGSTYLSMLLAFVLFAGVSSCDGMMADSAESSGTQNTDEIGAVGSNVVDFEVTTYSGESFTSNDLDGKVTMLIFWFPT